MQHIGDTSSGRYLNSAYEHRGISLNQQIRLVSLVTLRPLYVIHIVGSAGYDNLLLFNILDGLPSLFCIDPHTVVVCFEGEQFDVDERPDRCLELAPSVRLGRHPGVGLAVDVPDVVVGIQQRPRR